MHVGRHRSPLQAPAVFDPSTPRSLIGTDRLYTVVPSADGGKSSSGSFGYV